MAKKNDTALIQKLHKQFDSDYDELEQVVGVYCKDQEFSQLRSAYNFGLEAHRHQLRHSGDPYFGHCLNVAKILAELHMDKATIIGGLLHDTVEDTDVTLEDIREHFGDQISLLVDGVTKMSSIKFESKEARQAETFRKMLLSMAKDIRVIIIKFADRLHNMRTLQHLPEKKRPRIAIETRDVYAPLANRLGISRIKTELEDLALKHLQGDVYKDLTQKIKLSKEERKKYIESVTRPIRKEMDTHNLKAEMSGRPKSFFSIYNKMEKRNRPFEEIYDLLAIRIIVDKIEECYYILGLVHSLFMPVYDRFKDYIAMPKINGYQSLHTTVVGPKGRMVEIQIRTRPMHEMAEDGIAAHWKYKEAEEEKSQFGDHLSWVKDLLDRQMLEKDPDDFMENLKIDLFQDEVFVFSPRGDLIKLPRNSTPIDFAYAIHTNVGNHCIAAKVNGKIVALRTGLKSGQQVEIITSQNQKPSQDWLAIVRTSKARHWIKKIIREEQNVQTLQIGNEILSKYLKHHKINPESSVLKETVKQLGFHDLDAIRIAIGRGDFTTDQIGKKLFPDETENEPHKDNFFVKFLKRARSDTGIRVHGIDNMLIHFAKCCQPVPGDRIIGYLTRGKGVTIHRTDCKNMIKLYEEKERIIDVEWDIDDQQKFQVHLSILGEDRKNLLQDITQCISKQEINIISVYFGVEDLYAKGQINIEIKDLQHLTKIINNIRKVSGVFTVERIEDTARLGGIT